MTVLSISLKLLIFIAVGVVGRKLKVLGDGFDKLLNRFLIAVLTVVLAAVIARRKILPDTTASPSSEAA